MNRLKLIQAAALALAASGMFVGSAPAQLVGVERTTVYQYDTYVVGARRYLYNADWRLRLAQTDQAQAAQDLDAARAREGQIAVAIDNQQAVVDDLRRQVDSAGAPVGDLQVRLAALDRRVASARSDLEAARVLNDPAGIADADKRLRDNQAAAAATADQIRRAQDAEGTRQSLGAAQDDLARMNADLDAAHDAVFAAQDRLNGASNAVCLAVHDRDEALWLLYRDDLVAQRVRPEAVGFYYDPSYFRGGYPHDPEVLHAYFVRDVGYWRARPVEVETRIVQVNRVTEITRIREVERTHEVKRIRQVETFEANVRPEQRRAIGERVKVEQASFEAASSERKSAAAEGRKPRISPVERAQAKAIVINARADAKATRIDARADAKVSQIEAHADGKATKIEAHATKIEAQATRIEAQANKIEAQGTKIEARADGKAAKIDARAAGQALEQQSHANARATEINAHTQGKMAERESRTVARTAEINAQTERSKAESQSKTRAAEARATEARAAEERARAAEMPARSQNQDNQSRAGSDRAGNRGGNGTRRDESPQVQRRNQDNSDERRPSAIEQNRPSGNDAGNSDSRGNKNGRNNNRNGRNQQNGQ